MHVKAPTAAAIRSMRDLGAPQTQSDIIDWESILRREENRSTRRKDNQTMPPEAIFTASTKSHLRFQFRLHLLRRSQNNFQDLWCIRKAFAKVLNNNIVFTF